MPDYAELDTRLGWRFHDALELAIIGRNLLDHQHPEAVRRPGGVRSNEAFPAK